MDWRTYNAQYSTAYHVQYSILRTWRSTTYSNQYYVHGAVPRAVLNTTHIAQCSTQCHVQYSPQWLCIFTAEIRSTNERIENISSQLSVFPISIRWLKFFHSTNDFMCLSFRKAQAMVDVFARSTSRGISITEARYRTSQPSWNKRFKTSGSFTFIEGLLVFDLISSDHTFEIEEEQPER